MDWSNERYVRVYLRDTPEWTLLSWEARGLFLLLLRAVDRAGVLELGRSGTRALASLLRMPVEVVDRGLEELLANGCLERHGEVLLVRNYIEAQEAAQSDKVRQAESRERRRAAARRAEVTNRDDLSRNVTERHERSRAVTSGHEASRDVTPAVPCRAVPSQPCSDLPPAGAAGSSVVASAAGGIEPSGSAGELDLDLQIAPGAQVAAKAVKPRAKKPNASGEASTAATRELSDALCADFEELMRKKYAFKGGRDGPALPKLLELAGEGGIPEVRARFRWGIDPRNERDGGPPWAGRIATIVELADHKRWNVLARAPALPASASDFRGGIIENRF